MGVEAARERAVESPRCARAAACAVRHRRSGVPREDERDRDPRRARPRRRPSARTTSVVPCGRASARSGWRPTRSSRRSSSSRTSAPADPGEPTSAMAAMVRLRSLFAPDGPADQARVLGWGAATLEFLDRWRLPGEPAAHVWEERFGEHAYVPLAQAAFADACKAADVDSRLPDTCGRHRCARPRRACDREVARRRARTRSSTT